VKTPETNNPPHYLFDARLLRHWVNAASEKGLDLPKALQKSGLDYSELMPPQKSIELTKACKLMNYFRLLTQDEYYGQMNKPVPLGSLRLILLSLVHLQTMGQALERLLDFINILGSNYHYVLRQAGSQASLEMRLEDGKTPSHVSAIDFQLCFTFRLMGWLIDEAVAPHQITLSSSAPDYQDIYQHIYLGAPILFEHPTNSFSFDSSYLNKSIVQTEATSERYVKRAPFNLLLPLSLEGKITQLVKQEIRAALVHQLEASTLEGVAEKLNYNPQTLRRRLQKEGASYYDLKLQVRRDIAVHHLKSEELSVEAIAEKVGYTEASAFVRAFKQWTGLTPLQFRGGKKTNL